MPVFPVYVATSTSIWTAIIVIAHVAVLLPQVAVIVTVPAALADTTPELLTVATAVLDDFHVTVSVVFDGVAVAVSVTLLSAEVLFWYLYKFIVWLVLFKLNPVQDLSTVTVIEADLLPQLTVILAVPGDLAKIVPLVPPEVAETIATLVLFELHVILSVVLLGTIVGVNVTLSTPPTSNV